LCLPGSNHLARRHFKLTSCTVTVLVSGLAVKRITAFSWFKGKRLPELSRPRLVNRAENDLASSIAYFVLAGSLFVSLLEFFASLPGLP